MDTDPRGEESRAGRFEMGMAWCADVPPSVVAYVQGVLRDRGYIFDDNVTITGPEMITKLTLKKDAFQLHAEHHHMQKQLQERIDGKERIDEFDSSDADLFEGHADPDFFEPFERLMILASALEGEEVPASDAAKVLRDAPGVPAYKLPKSKKKDQRVNLVALLQDCGLLLALLPLHEEDWHRPLWAKMRKAIRVPVSAIHQYFGCQVAFYFAWMDFYTLWLLAPAVLGVCAHLLSVSVDRSTWAPMYSLFVVFWGILFVKFWARRCAHLAMEFRILDMGYDEDEVRSEYRGRLRKSYVTGHMERYFSPWQRLPRYAVSVLVSAAMLVVAFAVMVCSLNLQGYVSGPDPDTPTPAHAAAPPAGQGLELLFACPFHIPALARLASPGALFDPDGWPSLVPVLAHVAVVKLLNKLYSRMAKRLTRYENHRTEAEHENALVVKRFLFEAFDNYLALFYVGFYELDTERLRSEMVALYSIDSARRVFMETLLPLLLHWLQYSRKSRQAGRPKGAAPTETPPAVPPHPRQGSGWVKPRWTLRFSWHSGKDQSQPTDNVDVGKGDAATTKSEITTIRHEAGAEKTEAMTTALEGKPKSLRYRRLSGKAVEGKVSGGMACSDSILAGLDLRVLGPMLVQDANSKRLLSLTNGEDAHLKPLGLHQNGSAQNGVARLYSKVLAAKVPPVPLEAASVTVARLAPGKTGHEPSAGTLERGGPGGGSGSGKPRKGKGPLRRKLRETSRVLERCLSTVLDPSAPSVAEQLVCEEYDQFEDYLEMVIQFGYITLFASAYPLAAALSLVCNFVEIKSDSFKLMYLVRRPRPLKVRGIGIWTSLVHILVWTSIVTNSLIFSVSSEQMQVWFPYFFSEGPQGGHEFIPGRGRYAVGLTFLLEHAIGVLALVLMVAISDTPAAVKRERERREYERATRAREARHKKLLEMVQQRMQK